MELLKLLVVFLIIIAVMWLKKPLYMAIVAATLGTWLLYQLPAAAVGKALIQGLLSWSTIQLLLVLYLISLAC